jgi:hypothetical protein
MTYSFQKFTKCVIPTLLFTLAACGGGGGGGSSSSACDQIKIAGGQSCDVSNGAVVKLFITKANGSGGCTGTMISSDLLLTAGHCLIGASQVVVEASNGTTAIASLIRFNSNSNVNPAMDFGFAVVPSNFTTSAGISPLPVYLGSDVQLSLGTPIAVFGYGREDGNDGFGRFPRVANMTVTEVAFPNAFESSFAFAAVPDTNSNAPGATCMGDSGGPALVADDFEGIVGVAGVVKGSIGPEACSQGVGPTVFAGLTCGLVDVLRQYTSDLRTVSECI